MLKEPRSHDAGCVLGQNTPLLTSLSGATVITPVIPSVIRGRVAGTLLLVLARRGRRRARNCNV